MLVNFEIVAIEITMLRFDISNRLWASFYFVNYVVSLRYPF